LLAGCENYQRRAEQDYFCDGLVEDMITTLSKVAGLRVIARNSSFVFKGGSVDVREVAKQLGVRYVLEGSVRKSGNRIRVTAQLIDAKDGTHLWAERYDRAVDDIASRRIFPFIQRVFADSGYAGEKVAKATLIAVEIVRKNPGQVGFAVNPRRWVVERFFAWIGRNRRLAKDFEATIGSARAFLYAASVMLLVRRIANAS
jgi:TolB-like protein